MEALQFRLLGSLEIRTGDAPLAPLGSARAESLLARLLLHRDAPQPRQRLAFLLWPDSTEAQARTNLRHVLHNLRQALPDAERLLEVTPRTLRWRPEAPFTLDVADFEAALAREDLREAVGLYTGDLLEGSYDEWLLEEREALRSRFLQALARLSERSDGDDAIAYAERLLQHDPLREDTYRLLMRLRYDRGDRTRALRVYHACSAVLDRELGIYPSEPTRRLYESLLPESAPVPASPLAGPALVGRAGEWERLTELWRAAEHGRAQLVLVTGEAGIGKTRLVQELRQWCANRGAVTAQARSYAAEGALAYAPVVGWLRAEPIAARRDRLASSHRSELARLLPELSDPGVQAPAPLPESEQRRRLFDALHAALVPAGTPAVLVADDIHWADAETLRFLHYLLRSEPGAPLLVVATARREELDQPALEELRTSLLALDSLVELELPRLSRHETAVLAERLAGARLAEPLGDRLYAETEGNPLFVVEAMRAGWLRDEGESITPRTLAVLEQRLAQLSPAARELANLGATIGRAFTADELAGAGGVEAAALLHGLDELWRRRIVAEEGTDAYDFTHGKLRDVAYGALAPAQRRGHHIAVARALERVHAADPAPVSGELADHYERAGDRAAAVEWYGHAAATAKRLHANSDAVRLLERALELVTETERELALITAELAPLALVEGYGSRLLGERQRRAQALGAQLGVAPDPQLLRSLALASLVGGDAATAAACGEQLRSLGERDDDPTLIVEAAYVRGISAFWQADLDGAKQAFETAVSSYRPEHANTHLIRYGLDPRVVCMSRLANTLGFLGAGGAAEQTRDEALALAAATAHRPTISTVQVFAAMLCLELADADGLREHAAALQSSASGWRAPELTAEALAGYVEVLDGDHEAGLRRLRGTLGGAAVSKAPGQRATNARLLVDACRVAGDPSAGLDAVELLRGAGLGARLWEAEASAAAAAFLAALEAPADEVEAERQRARAAARRRGTLAERTLAHPARHDTHDQGNA